MNDLIESKNKITTELNDIIMVCNKLLNGHNDAMDILRQELKKVNEFKDGFLMLLCILKLFILRK